MVRQHHASYDLNQSWQHQHPLLAMTICTLHLHSNGSSLRCKHVELISISIHLVQISQTLANAILVPWWMAVFTYQTSTIAEDVSNCSHIESMHVLSAYCDQRQTECCLHCKTSGRILMLFVDILCACVGLISHLDGTQDDEVSNNILQTTSPPYFLTVITRY